jgi:tRNA-specific 2-thiouridylase
MKVAIGLSGGVDSSVSAHLLKEQGHELTGVFLECWRAPGCRAEEDRKDALQVALELGIPFQVLDFKDAYRGRVVDRFLEDYRRGLTPNPDIWCNTEIKFGLFYDWAMANGFDAVATGHYARVEKDSSGVFNMLRGADEKKDQTYFLYRTKQEQLEHILFPIGHLQKQEVRPLAAERKIHVADKPDSQGICFIGDINVHNFLRDELGENPGDVLDTDGNVIGTHQGHWFYTIGQRHGFELLPKVRTKKQEWKHVLPPLYVISKNAENNTITVGYGVETTRSEVVLQDLFWRRPELAIPDGGAVKARVRHGGALLPATLTGNVLLLEQPQRGLAAGQSVVLYGGNNDEVCLGGGVIGQVSEEQ